MSDNITVAIRMRPLIGREIKNNLPKHWKVEGSSCVSSATSSTPSYTFDRVFQAGEDNEQIYTEFCSPIIKSVVDGFNGTIFAYGQTSSGKTYTLMGNDASGKGKEKGIIHYTTEDIFSIINDMTDRDFLIRVSFMEIYCEEINDLLDPKNKSLKLVTDESGLIKVNGITSPTVQRPEQLLEYIRQGNRNRKTAETQMNDKSSRSHSIFQVIIESCLRGVEDSAVIVSQFNLVDLAGSERVSQTKVTGQQLHESKNINQSLLTLGIVIRQLSDNEQFVRYRESKLTRILQNSLGGNAKTAIICTVTPTSKEVTRSTLQFATSAKTIQNKPQINEVVTAQTLLRDYASQIKRLEQKLKEYEKTAVQDKQNDKDTCLLKIKKLQEQFVLQQPMEKSARKARRETWGGCMRNKNFPSSIPLPLFPPISTDLLSIGDARKSEPPVYMTSTPFLNNTNFDFARPSSVRSTLHSVQEENEQDFEVSDIGFASSRKSTFDEGYSAMYTSEIQSTSSKYDGLTARELIERIEFLENDRKYRKELEDFTTMERQVIRASCKNSSEFIKDLTSDILTSESSETLKNNSTDDSNCDLMKQQIEIYKDKVDIQTQMIKGLQDEIDLYKTESQSEYEKPIIDSCNNACQTSVIVDSNETECQTSFKDCEDFEIYKEEIKVQEQIIDHLQQELESLKENKSLITDKVVLNADCQTSYFEPEKRDVCTCDQSTSSTDLIIVAGNAVNISSQTSFFEHTCDQNTSSTDLIDAEDNAVNTSSQTSFSEHTCDQNTSSTDLIDAEDNAVNTSSQTSLSEHACDRNISSTDLIVVEDKNVLNISCQTSFLEAVVVDETTTCDSACQMSFVESDKPILNEMSTQHDVCTCDQNTSSTDLDLSLNNLQVTDESITAVHDLFATRSYVYGNMKKYMSEIMLEGVCEPVKTGSPKEQIDLEVKFVKSLLVHLDSYARNVSESSDYFKSLLEDKMYEVSSMQQKVDQAEGTLKKKLEEVVVLEASTSDLKNKFLAVLKRFEIPFYHGEDKYSSILQEGNTQKDMYCLKKLADKVESSFEEILSQKDDLSAKLAKSEDEFRSLKDKVDVAKRSRGTQATPSKDLETEIKFLNEHIESLKTENESLQSRIESMMAESLKEKEKWMTKTRDCVREIEEKCDKMMTSQENKHYDQLCDLEQKNLEKREKELEEYKSHLSKCMLEHSAAIERLKTEHAKAYADKETELSTARSESNAKSDKILKLNNHIMVLETNNVRMKQKGNLLLAKLKQMQHPDNKKDATTQTETPPQKEAGSQTRMLQTASSSCSNCQNNKSKTGESCQKLEFELERTKAKVLSLTTNNERLVQKVQEQEQELRTKLILLKNCRCRHFPMPISKSIEQQAEKRKDFAAELPEKTVETDEDILKNPIVIKAIQEAREYEKLKYTSIATGPANEVASFVYKHELNKANQKINQLQKELRNRARSHNARSVSPARSKDLENQNTVDFHVPKGSPPKAPKKPIDIRKNPFAPHQEISAPVNKREEHGIADLENRKHPKKDEQCKQQ